MFSYYGSKSKVINLYPNPKYLKIIEPFAGSARYSLKYFDHDVLLVDKYPVVVEIWKYLQAASEKDILSLPCLEKGEIIPHYLSDIETRFMGFIVADGASRPQKKVTSFSSNPEKVKFRLKTIANQLFKIRHWKIICADYMSIKNLRATWFIDPPYQYATRKYQENQTLDYLELSKWCRNRKGQVIVCENSGATWMNFSHLHTFRGQRKESKEVIWTN